VWIGDAGGSVNVLACGGVGHYVGGCDGCVWGRRGGGGGGGGGGGATSR
jgi:hypothetical protein